MLLYDNAFHGTLVRQSDAHRPSVISIVVPLDEWRRFIKPFRRWVTKFHAYARKKEAVLSGGRLLNNHNNQYAGF